MDWEQLKDHLEEVVLDSVGRILDGAKEDVEGLGVELAQKLFGYVRGGNEEGIDYTIARLRMLGERNRIRANDEAWHVLGEVLQALFKFGLGVMKV